MRRSLILASLTIAGLTIWPAVGMTQNTQFIYRDFRGPYGRDFDQYRGPNAMTGNNKSWFSRCADMNENPPRGPDSQLAVPGAQPNNGLRTWGGGRHPSDCPDDEAKAGKIPDWTKSKDAEEDEQTKGESEEEQGSAPGEPPSAYDIQSIPDAPASDQ